MGRERRGLRDGTGPKKDSYQAKKKGTGKRNGQKCPK